MKTYSAFGKLLCCAALGLGLLLPASRAAVNLVANSGFESGDLTSWSQSGNPGFTGVAITAVHSGTYGAFFGPVGAMGFISQTLTTVPGQTYQLDYWLRNNSGEPPNAFQLSWNGAVLTSLTNAAAFGYTQFSFGGLVATSTTTTLQFGFQHDPDYWNLDDVSVVQAGAVSGVPDSGTAAGLFALTLAGLVAVRRRVR